MKLSKAIVFFIIGLLIFLPGSKSFAWQHFTVYPPPADEVAPMSRGGWNVNAHAGKYSYTEIDPTCNCGPVTTMLVMGVFKSTEAAAAAAYMAGAGYLSPIEANFVLRYYLDWPPQYWYALGYVIGYYTCCSPPNGRPIYGLVVISGNEEQDALLSMQEDGDSIEADLDRCPGQTGNAEDGCLHAELDLGIDPLDNKICQLPLKGDPISIYSGNHIESEEDVRLASPFGKGFVFKRFYNSRSETISALGYGWTHTYQLSLKKNPSQVADLELKQK